MVVTGSWNPSSVKLWAFLVLLVGLCAWILPDAVEEYREYRSMERAIDILTAECAKRGGCTFDTRFYY